MKINGPIFYGMLISAANALDNKQELINNMKYNFFIVMGK